MQRGRARVTDDGSLCLGVSRFGVSNSASHCELRHWKNPNSRALATLCDNLCRSMEARGDQKIHTFYCWRLKESTPALARQQALALAARARASQTTEACAWAHRLSLRGLQQVSVNQGLVIAGKKIYEGSTCSAGARASRTTEACAWVYLASGSRTRLLIVSSATGKIQIQGLWRHCVTIFAEAWKRGGIRKSTLFIAGG